MLSLARIASGALVASVAIALCFDVTTVLRSETLDDSAKPSPIGEGPLDGQVFTGALGLVGKAKDTADSFEFENGMFVSKECERRCKYPARPYFVRVVGDKTEFISETKCPYKDANIIWRGTVEGDNIRGKATWRVNRWYWTVESTFEFEGKLSAPMTSSVSPE